MHRVQRQTLAAKQGIDRLRQIEHDLVQIGSGVNGLLSACSRLANASCCSVVGRRCDSSSSFMIPVLVWFNPPRRHGNVIQEALIYSASG